MLNRGTIVRIKEGRLRGRKGVVLADNFFVVKVRLFEGREELLFHPSEVKDASKEGLVGQN